MAAAPPPALLAPTSAGRQPLRSAHHRRGRRLGSVSRLLSVPRWRSLFWPGPVPPRRSQPSPAQSCPAHAPAALPPGTASGCPAPPASLIGSAPCPSPLPRPLGDSQGEAPGHAPPRLWEGWCIPPPLRPAAVGCAALPERLEPREGMNVREWPREGPRCRIARSRCSGCPARHGPEQCHPGSRPRCAVPWRAAPRCASSGLRHSRGVKAPAGAPILQNCSNCEIVQNRC